MGYYRPIAPGLVESTCSVTGNKRVHHIPNGPDGRPAEFFKDYKALSLRRIQGDDRNSTIRPGDAINVQMNPAGQWYIMRGCVAFKLDAKLDVDFVFAPEKF